jgi:lipoprotein-releasing system ATP-binding protein
MSTPNDSNPEQPMNADTAIVAMEHIAKRFTSGQEEVVVLQDINLTVGSGDVVTISGESGSGKSTLLNILGGLELPSAGTVRAAGYRVDELSEHQLTRYRNSILGLVFQFHYLLRDFTAEENVMLPAFMAGTARKRAVERAQALLDSVGLADRRGHFPTQLSGGERQRVAVARALVNEPRLILADEPTGNLDENHSQEVESMLFDLVRQVGTTLVLVTHDPRLAARGDRCYRLEHGVLNDV